MDGGRLLHVLLFPGQERLGTDSKATLYKDSAEGQPPGTDIPSVAARGRAGAPGGLWGEMFHIRLCRGSLSLSEVTACCTCRRQA